jgi:hypothetical protein
MSGIARAARWAVGALAGLSARDLAGVLVLAVLVVIAGCWVLRDEDRSRRLAEIIGSWRGARQAPARTKTASTSSRQTRRRSAASGPPVVPGSVIPRSG